MKFACLVVTEVGECDVIRQSVAGLAFGKSQSERKAQENGLSE